MDIDKAMQAVEAAEKLDQLFDEKDARIVELETKLAHAESTLSLYRNDSIPKQEAFREQLVCAALTGTLARAFWGPEEAAQEANACADATFDEYQRRAKERR